MGDYDTSDMQIETHFESEMNFEVVVTRSATILAEFVGVWSTVRRHYGEMRGAGDKCSTLR